MFFEIIGLYRSEMPEGLYKRSCSSYWSSYIREIPEGVYTPCS